MKNEAEPVEEHLQQAGGLERIVRGRENHPVGRLDLREERVPVVLQRTGRFALFEAKPAAPADAEPMIAERDDLSFDFAERFEVVDEPADGRVGIFL